MKRAASSAFTLLAVLAVACSAKNTDTGADASADGGPVFVGDTEPCKDLGIPEIACANGTTTAVCDTSGTAPRWQIRCDDPDAGDASADASIEIPACSFELAGHASVVKAEPRVLSLDMVYGGGGLVNDCETKFTLITTLDEYNAFLAPDGGIIDADAGAPIDFSLESILVYVHSTKKFLFAAGTEAGGLSVLTYSPCTGGAAPQCQRDILAVPKVSSIVFSGACEPYRNCPMLP